MWCAILKRLVEASARSPALQAGAYPPGGRRPGRRGWAGFRLRAGGSRTLHGERSRPQGAGFRRPSGPGPAERPGRGTRRFRDARGWLALYRIGAPRRSRRGALSLSGGRAYALRRTRQGAARSGRPTMKSSPAVRGVGLRRSRQTRGCPSPANFQGGSRGFRRSGARRGPGCTVGPSRGRPARCRPRAAPRLAAGNIDDRR